LGIDRKTIPRPASGSTEPKLAGGSQRKTEYSVEVRFVAMPANADSDVVFSAKDLSDPGSGATEHFDFRDDLIQPGWDRFGPL
jgi:hypothetical protein